MKKSILGFGISFIISSTTFGQLYSSGNNSITGNHVGIGTNTPLGRLHIYQTDPKFGGSWLPHIRLQSKGTNPQGNFDYNWDINVGNTLTFNGNGDGVLSVYSGGMNVGYLGNSKANIGGYAELASFANGEYLGLGTKWGGSNWQLSNTNGGALIYSDAGGNLEFWSANTAPLGLNANDNKHMVLTNEGKLGLGIDNPVEKLHLEGNLIVENNNASLILKNIWNASNTNIPKVHFQNPDNTVSWTINGSVANTHEFSISSNISGANNTPFHIDAEGHIGIGTTNTPTVPNNQGQDYLLFVKGGIKTEEIKVELCTNWCDYVFAPDYELLPLEKVEQTIKEKGHLHKIESAETIEKQGLELKSMTINQQEKIEELFLHMIEMDKRVKQLEQENAALRATLEATSK